MAKWQLSIINMCLYSVSLLGQTQIKLMLYTLDMIQIIPVSLLLLPLPRLLRLLRMQCLRWLGGSSLSQVYHGRVIEYSVCRYPLLYLRVDVCMARLLFIVI